jgi:hypothetical protein
MNYYSTKQEPKGTKIMTAEAQKSRCWNTNELVTEQKEANHQQLQ